MQELGYALIGRKLGHSYSPLIHQALGCPGYGLAELEPGELGSFLNRPGLRGLNVTVPYKKAVLSSCAELSPAARACGSVNTLVRRGDGSWFGENTDICGLAYMAKKAGVELACKKVLILGSGGAGSMAAEFARSQGAACVVVVSRRGEDNYQNLARHNDAGVIINATPVGMFPNNGEQPLSLSNFPVLGGLLELIYNPHRTALYMEAERMGIPRADGLHMLVAQAWAAEMLFMGKSIPEAEVGRVAALVRRKVENIVLIGMPGCGKSTVGRLLAGLSGRELVDTDSMVEQRAGCSIPEIFKNAGEAEFRRLESEALAAAGKLSGKVVATGGGVVKNQLNYGLLHQNGRIYHITRDAKLLSRQGRPLSAGVDLFEMERERAPLYASFRDAAVANDCSPENTARAIWEDFCENTCD